MPDQRDTDKQPRLILFHKQATSARLRFLCLPDGVLVFAPLPHPQILRETADTSSPVRPMPSAWCLEACRRLGLGHDALEAEPAFYEELVHDNSITPVLLAGFTAEDPPFALAQRLHGRFISLLESADRPALERELLRRAYECVMG